MSYHKPESASKEIAFWAKQVADYGGVFNATMYASLRDKYKRLDFYAQYFAAGDELVAAGEKARAAGSSGGAAPAAAR